MAESAESITTYQYSANNPVMFNDPLGNLLDPSKMATPIAPTQQGEGSYNYALADDSGAGEGTNDPAGLGIPDDGFNAWTNAIYNNILNNWQHTTKATPLNLARVQRQTARSGMYNMQDGQVSCSPTKALIHII